MNPEVSVILPCRNEARHLGKLVRSLLAQLPADGGFEIIAADGLSEDNTRTILQELASRHPELNLKVIDNPGRTAPCGFNLALRVARGKLILRMDAHTEYAPDYIRQCVATLLVTGAANVGGPWVARGQTYLSRAIAAAFGCDWVVGGARGHDPDYEGVVDTVYLGCWERSTLEKLGGFDEELVRNQDDELNLRITKSGGRVWQSPLIRSWYQPRNSLAELFKQYMQYGYWKVRVIQKQRLPASWRHLVPGAFVFALIGFGLGALCSRISLGLWLATVTAYALLNLIASISSARRGGWRLLPALPLVVACFHFGYGYGFLHGIWDFVIRRKGGSKAFTVLTRS